MTFVFAALLMGSRVGVRRVGTKHTSLSPSTGPPFFPLHLLRLLLLLLLLLLLRELHGLDRIFLFGKRTGIFRTGSRGNL